MGRVLKGTCSGLSSSTTVSTCFLVASVQHRITATRLRRRFLRTRVCSGDQTGTSMMRVEPMQLSFCGSTMATGLKCEYGSVIRFLASG